MRIVSYNILDGGEGRADPLAEVILAQRADIVALVEADDAAVLERIASRANMDYIHATGGRSGVALLSRWNLRETIDHTLLKPSTIKSLLEATVIEPGGREWTIGAVHLSANAREDDERTREQELPVVLAAFERHRRQRRPHLLVGDFNSNSPVQVIDPARCKKATQQAWNANGGRIPRRIVQKLLDAGYADSLDAFDPELARRGGSFTTQHPGQRIDYVFAWGLAPVAIKSAWIETDRLAKFASDHFPVGAEIVP